jgi:hypothetical protein
MAQPRLDHQQHLFPDAVSGVTSYAWSQRARLRLLDVAVTSIGGRPGNTSRGSIRSPGRRLPLARGICGFHSGYRSNAVSASHTRAADALTANVVR